MAIAYLGYVVVDATGDISQSITVPANTNYALIFRGGWSSTAQTVTSITLDGTAATSIRVVAATNDYQDVFLHGVPVTSGSKTLVHNLSGTFTEGGKVTVAFFSGVDTGNPSVASNYSEYAVTSSGTDAPTWALTSVADGFGAVFVSGYNDSATITVTSQSQTSAFNNLTYNSNIYGLGYKVTPGTSTTFGCSVSVSATYRYWTAVAVALRPFGDGNSYSHTASGGLTAGGAATLKRTGAQQASGGLTTGGAASASKSAGNSYSASGGLTTGGAAALKRTQKASGSGGLTTGGVGTLKLVKTTTASGGLTTGGSATLKRTGANQASGGLTTGGAASASKSSPGSNSYAGSGGLTTGGAAALKRTQKASGSGGLTTGGVGTLKLVKTTTASGGLATGGAAALKRARAQQASGGLTTGGAATSTLQSGRSHVASGGLSLSGLASLRILSNYVATGGLSLAGAGNGLYLPVGSAIPAGVPMFARVETPWFARMTQTPDIADVAG